MTPLVVTTRSPSPTPRHYCYLIAGTRLVCDVELACLEPLRVPATEAGGASNERVRSGAGEAGRSWRQIFSGDAWVGGKERSVRCDRSGDRLRVSCAGAGAFLIGPGGGWIEAEVTREAGTSDLETEVLVGPALMLALALRGVYAWHAGAVRTAGGVVALVGESGAGKSTLAAPAGAAWERVADDILPVGLVHGAALALPHYPQLKLPVELQYPLESPAQAPLVGVCEIGAPSEDGRVSVEELSPNARALCLISHTVAARLYPEELVEKHLDVCATIAAGTPVVRLRYPRTLDALPAARRALTQRLSKVGS